MNLVVPEPVDTIAHEETGFGVRALWVRVIIRALCDFVQWKRPSDLKSKREFLAVKKWLFDDNSSLPDICEHLGLNVERIRDRALTMTPNDVRKIEHRERDTSTQKNHLNGNDQ